MPPHQHAVAGSQQGGRPYKGTASGATHGIKATGKGQPQETGPGDPNGAAIVPTPQTKHVNVRPKRSTAGQGGVIDQLQKISKDLGADDDRENQKKISKKGVIDIPDTFPKNTMAPPSPKPRQKKSGHPQNLSSTVPKALQGPPIPVPALNFVNKPRPHVTHQQHPNMPPASQTPPAGQLTHVHIPQMPLGKVFIPPASQAPAIQHSGGWESQIAQVGNGGINTWSEQPQIAASQSQNNEIPQRDNTGLLSSQVPTTHHANGYGGQMSQQLYGPYNPVFTSFDRGHLAQLPASQDSQFDFSFATMGNMTGAQDAIDSSYIDKGAPLSTGQTLFPSPVDPMDLGRHNNTHSDAPFNNWQYLPTDPLHPRVPYSVHNGEIISDSEVSRWLEKNPEHDVPAAGDVEFSDSEKELTPPPAQQSQIVRPVQEIDEVSPDEDDRMALQNLRNIPNIPLVNSSFNDADIDSVTDMNLIDDMVDGEVLGEHKARNRAVLPPKSNGQRRRKRTKTSKVATALSGALAASDSTDDDDAKDTTDTAVGATKRKRATKVVEDLKSHKPGMKPSQLGYYPPNWKAMLGNAKKEMEYHVVVQHGFPTCESDLPDITDIVSTSIDNWLANGKTLEDTHTHTRDVNYLVLQHGGSYRSLLIQRVRGMVTNHYHSYLTPPTLVKTAAAKKTWIANSIRQLLTGGKYLQDDEDTNMKHPAVEDVVQDLLYKGSNPLAVEFAGEFDEDIPDHVVAFACTCVYFCLREWSTGARVQVDFNGKLNQKALNSFLHAIKVIRVDKCLNATFQTCKTEWIATGKDSLGITDNTETFPDDHFAIKLK